MTEKHLIWAVSCGLFVIGSIMMLHAFTLWRRERRRERRIAARRQAWDHWEPRNRNGNGKSSDDARVL